MYWDAPVYQNKSIVLHVLTQEKQWGSVILCITDDVFQRGREGPIHYYKECKGNEYHFQQIKTLLLTTIKL